MKREDVDFEAKIMDMVEALLQPIYERLDALKVRGIAPLKALSGLAMKRPEEAMIAAHADNVSAASGAELSNQACELARWIRHLEYQIGVSRRAGSVLLRSETDLAEEIRAVFGFEVLQPIYERLDTLERRVGVIERWQEEHTRIHGKEKK